MDTRTWQVTADVWFPNHFDADFDESGQPRPPQQLIPKVRIPRGHRQVDRADVFVYEGDKPDDLRFSLGHIAVRIDSAAGDPSTALQEAIPIFDRVLESLSFQMQAPLPLGAVSAIDLTGSPAVGEDRNFAQWSGLALPTFVPTSVPMQSLTGRPIPDLTLDLDPDNRRANRALDWYLKALAAPYEADHFIFLWIACEILEVGSDTTVSGPYRGPCGHDIVACPTCDTPTSKRIQGPSMKQWLTDGYGVPVEVADLAWKARQMLHGADAFSPRFMGRLPEVNQWLRHVVVVELKRRLGMPADQPPIAAPTGLTISPHLAVAGTRKVTQQHLAPLGEG